MDQCLFNCNSAEGFSNVGPDRIRTIIKSSKLRNDSLHLSLQEQLDKDGDLMLKCHRSCVSTYTSPAHIQRYLKRKNPEVHSSPGEPTIAKRLRMSEQSFDFQTQCLFCGEICYLEPDKKHPDRWRKAVLCTTADRGRCKQTLNFKEAIIDTCMTRNDEWGNQVISRVQGIVSDLHAVGGRYHKDCRNKFMSERNISYAAPSPEKNVDDAFQSIVSDIKSDKSRIWTSVEIFDSYVKYGGVQMTRRYLVEKLSQYFQNDFIVLSSPGLANICMFRDKASEVLRIVEADGENTYQTVAKQIVQEIKGIKVDRSVYSTRIDTQTASKETSPTLMSMLSCLSDKLDCTLPAVLIGNIITSMVQKCPTTLQVALGNLVRGRSLIDSLYDFGITCSYDEILRFKTSAAAAAAKETTGGTNSPSTISSSTGGLIQIVADNFDANISSQNGLRSTHGLAMLLTQKEVDGEVENETDDVIPRISKGDMTLELKPDLPIHNYKGSKKPEMPNNESKHSPLPLKVLAEQTMLLTRANDLDFEFLKSIVSDPNTPEYGGFNVKKVRESGESLQSGTKAMYTPLIDMKPADPDTMMTAMTEAKRLTIQCGQTYTIFTADQQLYKIMTNIMWVHHNMFENFIPRLGGMHTLMSFVGCVGHLMSNSGIEEVMQSAFGGVARMLTGKNFPQNTRALRMVTEEVLRNVIGTVESHDELISVLEDKASRSRTTRLWVENLIKPVFIMMLFVRAEREAKWPLHLLAVNAMMPYFFAAGHTNYARYCLYYLRFMERLPREVLSSFLKGEHVMRHKPGYWNAIWSDMYIETTFMRYGHGPGGLIGITLNQSALKRWPLSLHTCSRLIKDIANMRHDNGQAREVKTHKEESPSRIQTDKQDRENIRTMLETCVDPLKPDEHPEGIINIVSGRVSQDSVNVDRAVDIGKQQMIEYEEKWPGSFYSAIPNKVVTLATNRKTVKIGAGSTFDTNLIYSRAMGLIGTREVKLKVLFQHELAPLPTSMFDDTGEMRITKTKSKLKRCLQVEHIARANEKPVAVVIDGCAILWVVSWPSHGTIEDYIENIWEYVVHKLRDGDVYLVFDRYFEYSIKSCTRQSRAAKIQNVGHKLRLNTPLPSKQVVLTVTENKVQLIDLICYTLNQKAANLPETDDGHRHRLVTTGSDFTPIEVHYGVHIERHDMKTSHEEADVIMPHYVMQIASNDTAYIAVISDDTDVFLILMHHYYHQKMTCKLIMQATSSHRATIDISETVKKHEDKIPHLLAAHALSGCDSVAYLYGIGKARVVKVLENGCELTKVGNLGEDFANVINEATRFVTRCYGSKDFATMSDVRYQMWLSKNAKKGISRAPELKSLPPTTECFEVNVRRAHLQTAIWKAAVCEDPPNVDPGKWGWSRDKNTKQLLPVSIPADVASAPAAILQMIRCGCAAELPCSSNRCGCSAAQLTCTLFCNCSSSGNCCNRWNKEVAAALSDDEEADQYVDTN